MSELLTSGMPISYYKLDKDKELFSRETKVAFSHLWMKTGVVAIASRFGEPMRFFRKDDSKNGIHIRLWRGKR